MNVRIESSWQHLLAEEFEKHYFKSLTDFVKEQYQTFPDAIFPKPGQIFRAFDTCPLDQLKVVILGQDPYPTKGHANGLSFSVNPDVKPLAKSLTNIFVELASDLGIKFPPNGDLTRWAMQGVLLLNSILTVQEGQPLSHKGKGWELFTDAVIAKIAQNKKNIVFMLWGSKSVEKIAHLNLNDHLVLTSVHPSPLSAHRGFFGCKHFSKANEYLQLTKQSPINW